MRHNRREQQETTLTIADVCGAVERRLVSSLRQGDDFVLRLADLRRIQVQHDDLLEELFQHEVATLDVSRTA